MVKLFWEFVSFFGTLLAGLAAVALAFVLDTTFGCVVLGNLIVITALSNTYKVYRFKPRPDNPEGFRPPNPISGATVYRLLNPKVAIAYFHYVDMGSFPSIHSARSFNQAALFSWYLSAHMPSLPAVVWWAGLLASAALIAWSRVVKLRHFKTDISAGAVLGLVCAALSMGLIAF
jgi:membrane-associated phospholipid phosphatase